MSSKSRLARVLLTSAIAVSLVALTGERPDRAQLAPDSDEPVSMEALPIRAELARSAYAQSSAPMSPGKPELRAHAEDERAPSAVVAARPAAPAESYRQYRLDTVKPAVDDPDAPKRWVTDSTGSSAKLVKRPASSSRDESMAPLCPASESGTDIPPTCSAVALFSPRGYRVLPNTHVHLGVASDKLKLVVRVATF